MIIKSEFESKHSLLHFPEHPLIFLAPLHIFLKVALDPAPLRLPLLELFSEPLVQFHREGGPRLHTFD